MKALTLTQPWATLIVSGEKSIETRSWPTNYRGPLAIHAAKGLGPVGGKRGLEELLSNEPFWTFVRQAPDDLPRGAVVAVARLVDCVVAHPRESDAVFNRFKSHPHESSFGFYGLDRWAWILELQYPLLEPVPATGKLGLWNLPLDVENRVRAQREVRP